MTRNMLALLALVACFLLGCPTPSAQIVALQQLPNLVTAPAATPAALRTVQPGAQPIGPSASLKLRLYTAARRVQYVNVLDWIRATATLSNSDSTIPTLSQTATAAVDASDQRTADFTLSPVKPASGYTLSIDLDRQQADGTWQTVASGTSSALTIASGTNSLSVPLTPTANGKLVVSVPSAVIPIFLIVVDFYPASGSVGMDITLTGSGFAAATSGDLVTFNGATATVLSGNTGGLVAAVPSGATSGPIHVSANGKNTTTSTFSVVPSGTVLGTYSVGTNPHGVAVDASGDIWVANKGSNNVQKLSPKGAQLGTYSTGGGPDAVAVGPSGNVWVANYASDTVVKLDSSGNQLASYNVDTGPVAIAVDKSSNAWVCCNTASKVDRITSTGTVSGISLGSATNQVAIDSSGNAYVDVSNSTTLYEISPSGSTLRTANEGAIGQGLGIDSAGNIWCVDSNAPNVKKLAVSNLSQMVKVKPSAALGNLAIDKSDNCWIVDPTDNLVDKVTSGGTIGTNYTVGTSPVAVAVAPSGAIVVANSGSNNVTVLAP